MPNANNKLVTGEYTRSIATGISDLLVGKEISPLGFGFRQIYLIFDLLVLSLLWVLLWRLSHIHASRATQTNAARSNPVQSLIAAVGVDLVLLGFIGGAFWYLLSSYRTTLSNAMLGQQDMVIAFSALIGLAFINGITRLLFIFFRPGFSRLGKNG